MAEQRSALLEGVVLERLRPDPIWKLLRVQIQSVSDFNGFLYFFFF